MNIQYKRPIIIGTSVAVLSIAGVGVATTVNNSPTQQHVQLADTNGDTTPQDLKIDTEDKTPVDEPVVPTQDTVELSADSQIEQNTNNSDQVVAAPSRVETYKNLIASQAAAIAPLYKWTTEEDFIAVQLQCLTGGATEDMPQSAFDQGASFLVPQTLADGRTQYKYFTGGCRVIFDIR